MNVCMYINMQTPSTLYDYRSNLTLPGEEKPLSGYEYSVLDTETVVSLPGGVCLLLIFQQKKKR